MYLFQNHSQSHESFTPKDKYHTFKLTLSQLNILKKYVSEIHSLHKYNLRVWVLYPQDRLLTKLYIAQKHLLDLFKDQINEK
jgi:hypothetical protein